MMNVLDEEETVTSLKKKLKNIRQMIRNKLAPKKRKTGTGADEVEVEAPTVYPSWWDDASFLISHCKVRESFDNLKVGYVCPV